MANLIDITTSILSQNTICFETRNINIEHIPVPIENSKFGILNFKAVTANQVNSELDFVFMIDCSGSMSDRCSDGRSKMQHIIHTLKNMIIFFREKPSAIINFTVKTFDTQIYSVINRTKITDENFDEIITKIEQIRPLGSTNIESALRESADIITYLQELYPENIINHIFMTDGEATDGSKDIEVLKNSVNPQIFNAFIGFGIDHDAPLLNSISSVGKSCYYFVDKLESAGIVYGEILHRIIYNLLTDVEIIIEGGLIYNFKTNIWEQSIRIEDIVSEANKTYNIVSNLPDECKVNVKGKIQELVILFPSTNIGSESNTDLTQHIYRQRTLQLLYEVNNFTRRRRESQISNSNIFNFTTLERNRQISYNLFNEEQKNIKTKLIALFDEIKKYMADNNLNENKFLKNLCDDIYICYRTFGTKYGDMFITGRHTSQGSQRQYTVSNTSDINDNLYDNRNNNIRINPISPIDSLRVHRQNNINYFNQPHLNDFIDDENDLYNNTHPVISQHQLSAFDDTPYLTPQATQVIREISCNTYEFDEEKNSRDTNSLF